MIVPAIDLMGGRTVQLVEGRGAPLDLGEPRPWLERFSRVGEVTLIDLDAALGRGSNEAAIEVLLASAPCRVGGGIRTVEAARRWLDRGAIQVILGTAATPEILGQLPSERVIAALDAREGEVVVEGWRKGTGVSIEERMRELAGLVGGFLITFVEREGHMKGTDLERVRRLVDLAGGAKLTVAGGVTSAAEIAELDRLGVDAQVGMAIYTGRLGLSEAFAAPLQSDRPDGLWPTVVVDERGRALGLAWSNEQSLREAIDKGEGVYWSRQRGLWRKGERSGATQRLLRVDLDCDRDALRFVVRQEGAGFCHRGTWGCFGEERGLGALARTLGARKAGAPEGSYTARLFEDPSLLAAKLEEEARELAEARGSEAVIHEAADLLYFASVALAREGVRLEDVEEALNRRALKVGRQGGERKAAAELNEAGKIASGTSETRPSLPGESADPAMLEASDVARALAENEDARRTAEAESTTGQQSRTPEPQINGRSYRLLRIERPESIRAAERAPIDPATLAGAERLVAQVREGGEAALRSLCARFEDLGPGGKLFWTAAELREELERLPPQERALLERTAARVRSFAEAQLASLREVEIPVPGGRAGQALAPMERAGCYVPSGRFPLPSSALMTTIPAKVAGVQEVWVASPRPTSLTLAAAAIGGAHGLIAAGGAHGIAALAYGAGRLSPCDVVVGPGNRWVTAAKKLIAGEVAIDTLAGPSELVVVADGSADAERIAADLLAQAEHDPDASPILVSTSAQLVDEVEEVLAGQLATLPTAKIASAALSNGFAVIASSRDEAARICDRLAPEHVELHLEDPRALGARLRNYGALFLGAGAAEVLGDYGIGPNHVLPTGRGARSAGGLSPLSFLRVRTWLEVDDLEEASEVLRDAAAFARLEGLEGHARAAEMRIALEEEER